MKNFIKLVGIIVLLAIIGFVAVSCDLEEETYKITYINNSSHTVNVDMNVDQGWKPASFSIASGESQIVVTNKSISSVKFSYSPGDKVKAIWYENSDRWIFTNNP
jgi:hypothetical protein